MEFDPRSHVAGIDWPALLTPQAASILAMELTLSRTQWWSLDALRDKQLLQLGAVLQHAVRHVPLYRRTYAEHDVAGWADAMNMEQFRSLPVLNRHDLLDAGDELSSRAYPALHGKPHPVKTSGSTGKSLQVLQPGVAKAMWLALTLREHLWHRRDLAGHLAAIRHVHDAAAAGAVAPHGMSQKAWGSATSPFYPDAPSSLLSIATPVDEQLDWLLKTNPDYLLTYPSNLAALLQRVEARGVELPKLQQVRTISEAVDPDLPARCRTVLGVPLVDTYTAEEVGYIAMQCPDAAGYHVMSESVLVEILRDDGGPCGAGETGRVVVSALHNFATPLLRYELDDYAETGPPCSCGRGLPVLQRIHGRRRAMLRYPDGRVVFPVFTNACRTAAPFRVMQLIQESLEHLRALVVPEGELTVAHERALIDAIVTSFGHAFTVTVERVAEIPRTRRGKLDEFVSHVSDGP